MCLQSSFKSCPKISCCFVFYLFPFAFHFSCELSAFQTIFVDLLVILRRNTSFRTYFDFILEEFSQANKKKSVFFSCKGSRRSVNTLSGIPKQAGSDNHFVVSRTKFTRVAKVNPLTSSYLPPPLFFLRAVLLF